MSDHTVYWYLTIDAKSRRSGTPLSQISLSVKHRSRSLGGDRDSYVGHIDISIGTILDRCVDGNCKYTKIVGNGYFVHLRQLPPLK